MSKINTGRVILGGLLAGLVINIGETLLNAVILADQWKACMASLNRPPITGGAISWFVISSFLSGLIGIWVYAAVRPRLGAGPKTAVLVGLWGWFLAWFSPLIGGLVTDIYPANVVWPSAIWGLIEAPLAAVIGAWFYKE